MFAAVKDIRRISSAMSKEYQHVGEKLMQMDVLNKEWTAIEEDFNILSLSQGMIKLSNYYSLMSECFYDCLRRSQTFSGDTARLSYRDLWESRQHSKQTFLALQDSLIDRKLKLFAKPHLIESHWGIKDKLFLAQNRDYLQADFEFAAPYMLNEETEKCIRLQKVYMYMNN